MYEDDLKLSIKAVKSKLDWEDWERCEWCIYGRNIYCEESIRNSCEVNCEDGYYFTKTGVWKKANFDVFEIGDIMSFNDCENLFKVIYKLDKTRQICFLASDERLVIFEFPIDSVSDFLKRVDK